MNHMDYILHPIPLSDINRPIYYMVRSFFLHLVGGLPHDDLYEEWEGVKVEATFGDYLVFPSADLSVSYDRETLKREVIMAPPRSGVLPPETKEALAFQKKEKNKRAGSGRIDSCCVCGKALFKSGKRQDSLCWQIAILRKEAIKAAGIYTDSSGACVSLI